MSATHSISLGPLSLLASQNGKLLTITIHTPSDTAPVGRMTLTVAEWTALVTLVDCMGAAEKRHAEDRAEIERLSASVDRYQDAAWAGIEESSDNVECCAVGCSIVCASMNARASGWTINRNGLPFCSEHADRAFNPTETKSDRDSLRQQVRELTEENERLRGPHCNGCGNAIDEDVCWCGDEYKYHTGYEGHPFVAMGCDCLHDDRDRDWKKLADARSRQLYALRSDLSAALVSVDAMGERLRVVNEEIERMRKALGEACDLGKKVAWRLHRECPNDLDETEHPNMIRRFNELRALATQKDGGKR